MTDTVGGLGPAADTSQGKLSASHHYKWQSAASRPGSFSMRGPSSGACRCLCRSRGPFDFLIPARARGIQALHEKYHAQSVIYALTAQKLSGEGIAGVKQVRWKKTPQLLICTPCGLRQGPAQGLLPLSGGRGETGGGWVNKCLEFIRGVHCDSYYTNIHACFSPPSISYCMQDIIKRCWLSLFLCLLLMFVKFQRKHTNWNLIENIATCFLNDIRCVHERHLQHLAATACIGHLPHCWLCS